MIITRVKLENFGRHKSREFACNASVVGLLGRNGCGKSTFLQAIEFGITGMLRDKADSYIRHGAKRAIVELEFVKNGQTGVVTRKINPSNSSRELQWQGKTYTKSGDVDSIMADVLNADRQAVSNAVFLEQGSLDKILFSSQAEREQLFTRMLNVSFLEKTCGVLDGKIKALSAGIEDLSIVFDEVSSQTKEAETNMHRLAGEVSAMPDNSARVVFLRRLIETLETIQTFEDKIDSTRVMEINVGRQLTEALNVAGFSNLEAVQVRERQLESDRDTLVQVDRTLRNTKNQRANWDRLNKDLENYSALLTETSTSLQELLGKDIPDVNAIQNELREATQLEANKKQLADYQAQVQKLTQQLHAHCSTARPNADVSEIEKEIDALNVKISAVKQERAVLTAVLDVQKAATECCPLCRQKINPALLDRARLSDLGEEESQLQKSLNDQVYKRLHVERVAREWDSAKTRITDNVHQAYAQCTRLKELVEKSTVTKSIDELSAALKLASETTAQINALRTRETELKANTLKAKTELQALDPFRIAIENFNEVALTATSDALTANQQARMTVNSVITNVRSQESKLAQLSGERKGLEATLNAAKQSLDMSLHDSENPPTVESLKLEKADLEGKEALRLEAIGRSKQAREQYSVLQAKLVEIQARRSRNESRQSVVQELSRIREVFGRGNLPMAYVTYQFQRLAVLTQEVLNEMGAPFTIEVDQETPITFKFTRLDDPDAVPLDMAKLSGGQRVRLSIAFLVAVQRLIIPDVGLLILDEPTTHLDAEAVDSVKDLLMSLSTILENTNSQVWVVDHNPSIQAALGAHISLEN